MLPCGALQPGVLSGEKQRLKRRSLKGRGRGPRPPVTVQYGAVAPKVDTSSRQELSEPSAGLRSTALDCIGVTALEHSGAPRIWPSAFGGERHFARSIANVIDTTMELRSSQGS